MNKYRACHIANYFINKPIYTDNIRVNKLVYITYGFYYAYFDKRLFSDIIEAWRFGPVIPSIYHGLKKHGYSQINTPYSDKNTGLNKDKEKNENPPEVEEKDEKINGVLEAVVEIYGDMSAIALIDRTHKKGTPWEQTYKESIFHLEIEDSLIIDYYKKLLNI